MAIKNIRQVACALLSAVLVPSLATAQGLDTIGSRPAGLAAFVAVADDASAIVWNPAGLVTGPIFNISLDLGRNTYDPDQWRGNERDAQRVATTLVALGTTPVGIAYYRIATSAIDVSSPAVVGSPDRQEGQVALRTLVTSHLGATVQQSLGSHLTIGTTLKLVRADVGVGSATVSSWDEAFDAADRVDTRGSTRGDLDLGVMASAGRMRAGLLVRNVTEPTFEGDDDGAEATLRRHARLGVAWADRWPGISRTIVAFDADLTRIPHAGGERRDVAVGVERWIRQQRIGVRAGIRASTLGDARPVVSGGGSYGLWAGLYVEGYVARGRAADRAWGIAARMTY